ncbi:MAG: rane protein [Solirubrobacteraceae bacterium]|nr:rane protein [Solirubrobacteraceae bacterium]
MPARLVREARTLEPRKAWRAIHECFERNDLLTYASAISFQVFFALIPLLLLGLALLGAFGLTEVWTSDAAVTVRQNTSPAAFRLIDQTVRQVLQQKEFFWATAGALIAIWEVSGAMRATMQVLNRVYGAKDDRPFKARLFLSLWLSGLVTVVLLAAAAVVTVVPRLVHSALVSVGVWLVAAALMTLAVGMIVRFAPAKKRPMRWVSFGSLLVITGWIGASLVYGWYVTSVADYGSIFGSLAVVMITLSYIYIQAIVFLTGVQLDSLIRRQVEESEEREAAQSKLILPRSVLTP